MIIPNDYDYYYYEQYYKSRPPHIFVWRIDEWVKSKVSLKQLKSRKRRRYEDF